MLWTLVLRCDYRYTTHYPHTLSRLPFAMFASEAEGSVVTCLVGCAWCPPPLFTPHAHTAARIRVATLRLRRAALLSWSEQAVQAKGYSGGGNTRARAVRSRKSDWYFEAEAQQGNQDGDYNLQVRYRAEEMDRYNYSPKQVYIAHIAEQRMLELWWVR